MGYSFFSGMCHSQHHIWKESCFSLLSSWLYAVSGQVYHFCDLHSITTSSLYDSTPDNKQACIQSTDDDRES